MVNPMQSTAPTRPANARSLSIPEFVAMLAVLFATVAFSIDAMLPALPEMANIPDVSETTDVTACSEGNPAETPQEV